MTKNLFFSFFCPKNAFSCSQTAAGPHSCYSRCTVERRRDENCEYKAKAAKKFKNEVSLNKDGPPEHPEDESKVPVRRVRTEVCGVHRK